MIVFAVMRTTIGCSQLVHLCEDRPYAQLLADRYNVTYPRGARAAVVEIPVQRDPDN